MKNLSIAFVLVIVGLSGIAQDRFYTKNGKVSFYSKAPLENIIAQNRSVVCVLDSKTGNVQFAVQIKGFEFKKALMQEHFNEDYMESAKFPKAEFRGQVLNQSDINYSTDGVYDAKVRGKLTIHGQTRDVETSGRVTVKSGRIQIASQFNVSLSDYKIKNDKLNNISNNIQVTVDCSLDPLRTSS